MCHLKCSKTEPRNFRGFSFAIIVLIHDQNGNYKKKSITLDEIVDHRTITPISLMLNGTVSLQSLTLITSLTEMHI